MLFFLKNRIVRLLLIFSCVYFPWKLKLSDSKYILIKNRLIINVPKKDPPRVAFEEIFSELETTRIEGKSNIQNSTQSGSPSSTISIVNLNQSPNARNVLNAIRYKHIIIGKLTLQKSDFIVNHPQEKSAEVGEWIAHLGQKYTVDTSKTSNGGSFIIQSQSEDGSVKTPRDLQPQSHFSELRSEGRSSEFELKGTLRLLGEAFGEGRRLEVFRSKNGTPMEKGVVDVHDASFKIKLEDLSGTLVAQLVDQQNSVVAQASKVIDQDSNSSSRNVELELTSNILTINDKRNISFHGLEAGNRPNKAKSITSINSISKGSDVLTYSSGNGAYPGVHWVTTDGRYQSLPLYRETMVKALLDITSEIQVQSLLPVNHSVVWGQVLFEGKPAAGIKVRVEEYEDVRPFYFNAIYIPESRLIETSDNGVFSFVNLPTGFYSITAEKGDQYFSHGNVWVEEGRVSSLTLESLIKKHKVEISSFDAFSGNPVETQVDMQSVSKPFDMNGNYSVYLPPLDRISLVYSKPYAPEYLPTCSSYSDGSEFIHLPFIQNQWLEGILSSFEEVKGIQMDESDHSYIIGFIQHYPFQAKIIGDEAGSDLAPLYFDDHGKIVSRGVPGGGFLFVNVPLGLSAIQILNIRSSVTTQMLVPVHAGYINVAPNKKIEYY